MVARLGGDEFIVMLKDIHDQHDITKYVERILLKFQTPLLISEHQHMITCSIGIATYPENGETAEELIKNADDALYNLKGRGKNGFVIFNKNIKNQSLERRLLENALRSAIRDQQFYLEYQPKINLSTHELMGMEALVRWKHPDLGTIPPGKFIPLAEETGLIIPLGEWILRESCRQAKQWQKKGYSPLLISVNVSVLQLEDPYFINLVEAILQETGFDPQWLELEVTESVFADVKNSASILQEIRNLGIQISIDDFGTGYSSLSYLKNLPIDTLKVDQSFIQDIHINEESRAIVNAVITLANTLGLNVIAEGIELQEHIEELNKDGCILGQGFYFSRPLTSEAFEEYINHLTDVK
jgi:EAL domain-containing protein (putative c-di-GMP-specific phosphodiesterase class I)